MDGPVIGICAALEPARFGAWDELAVLTPYAYVRAVQAAGGIALVLAPDPAATADPDPWLDRIDGLLLAGGVDVDPATYGATPHPQTRGSVPQRDAFELALTRGALARDLPLLGICRGMQVMNVAGGGTLVQHLPDVVGHENHRRNLGTFAGNEHRVRLSEGSVAARAAGETDHRTLSHHHQAVDTVAEGFVVTGWAEEDQLVEAFERPDRRFALGVQWHPEADETSRVVGALVAEARAARQA